MDKVNELIKKYGDKIILLGCAIMLIGVFLPMMSVTEGRGRDSHTERTSLFSNGVEELEMNVVHNVMVWGTIATIIAIAAVTHLKKAVKYLYVLIGIATGLIISIVFSVLNFENFIDFISTISRLLGGTELRVNIGWGLWVMIAGLALIIAYMVLNKERAEATTEVKAEA